jgi:hypothetical protein
MISLTFGCDWIGEVSGFEYPSSKQYPMNKQAESF